MVQVLPYVPGFGERLAETLGQTVGNVGSAYLQNRQQNRVAAQDEQILDSFNPEDPWTTQISKFSKLSKARQEIMTPIFNQLIKGQQQQATQSAKLASKQREEQAPVQNALATIKRQRELLASGHLGSKTGTLVESPKMLHLLSKEGRKARSEYERLGKSLIGMASNIPIRNQQEFAILAEGLYDPSKTQAEIEGNLDAMQRILENKLSGEQQTEEAAEETELTDDVIDNLLKKYSGDVKKAKAEAKKMGYKF